MQLKIETSRLIIQSYTDTYLDDYYKEFTDEIVKWQYPDRFPNKECAGEFLARSVCEMEAGHMLELVILARQGEFLGSMEVFGVTEETPEIGLWLKESARGTGYGHEALKALLSYLDSERRYKHYIYEADIRNEQSKRLVNKFPYEKGRCQRLVTESGKELILDTYCILPGRGCRPCGGDEQ